jgi:hypothetical protein
MEIKVTEQHSFILIELLKDGKPVSGQNPVGVGEFSDAEKPEAQGTLAVLTGMPMAAVAHIACFYKNCFGAIAVANPREGVAEVIHSVSQENKVGSTLPLS